MGKQVSIDLAHYRRASEWRPMQGDIIIHHGLLTHWFGIVSSVGGEEVTVIRAGLPRLLLTMDGKEKEKSARSIKIDDVRSSNGNYAVQQLEQGILVWYI